MSGNRACPYRTAFFHFLLRLSKLGILPAMLKRAWSELLMINTECKILESRLRRKAQRFGFSLVKSRRRDPDAPDYGKYMILEIAGSRIAAAGLEFDEVASYLKTARRAA